MILQRFSFIIIVFRKKKYKTIFFAVCSSEKHENFISKIEIFLGVFCVCCVLCEMDGELYDYGYTMVPQLLTD